ncbi:MAG: RHS repeat-associated core domain-containing protein [Chlamydiales bacterium]|nr:RHS repeat-associated core domain-containing protein [Chlamydiales bacterium]
MRIFYLFFYFLPLLGYSENYIQHTEVRGSPSGVVAGCVNAVTGSYSFSRIDFVVPGPDTLTFQRFYCSGDWEDGASLCNSWTYNHPKEAFIGVWNDQYRLVVPEPSGGVVSYVTTTPVQWYHDGHWKHARHLRKNCNGAQSVLKLDAGLTNTSWDCCGGNMNLKNQTASFDAAQDTITAQLCNGCTRTFERLKQLKADLLPIYYTSVEETLPSGNRFCYRHCDENSRMACITATNSSGSQTFGSLKFDYPKFLPDSKRLIDFAKIPQSSTRVIGLQSGDNRTASYTVKVNAKNKSYLTEAITPNSPKENYFYQNIGSFQERLCRREGPDERFIDIGYYHQGINSVCGRSLNLNMSNIAFGRVKHLKSPVGSGPESILTYSFFYEKGVTEVRDAYNRRTIYRYNDGHRLEAIEHFLGRSDAEYQKYATERLYWGAAAANQHCNLICSALLNAQDQVHSCRHLTYDAKHNVTEEALLGDLSGTCAIAPQLDVTGTPIDNGCERYVVTRTYSQDNFNLKTSETFPNGRHTTYLYKAGTNLVVAQLTSVAGVIEERQFFQYDDNATLLSVTADDGCGTGIDDLNGVTIRKITRTTPRTETPCLGLPEKVEEFYYDVDTGSERSLGSILYTYTNEGWISRQDHYDASGAYRFTLSWEYDRFGNVILEQNAIGEVTIRRFDEHSNKLFEQIIGSDFYTEYQYDRMNQLVRETVVQENQRLEKRYRYDWRGNRIASTDIFGNTTDYEFDDRDRVISSTLPECNGQRHVIKMEYDIANNITAEVDALSNITHKKYTIRGRPTLIEHPDGRTERNEYNSDGALRLHLASNGTYTKWRYDALGNVICKEIYSPNHELLAKTSATYKSFLITSETDANGNVTSYRYDGAGRLTHILKPEGWTRFEYDGLGRKFKTIQWIGPEEDNVRITIQEFDLLNRVVEERVEDAFNTRLNQVNFEYDLQGNRSAVTRHFEQGPSTTLTEYNPFGEPTKIVDADGNETLFHYEYNGRLIVTLVDALGRQTITTHDTLGNPACIIKKDPFGNELSKTELKYNALGKPEIRLDTVKANNTPDRTVITEWQYDTLGRLVVIREAVGTPLLRQTYYSYNVHGQRESDILPSGIILRYAYDAFNRLSHHTSSDGSIDYSYSYDSNGNLLSVFDAASAETTSRVYDHANRMTKETLATGLALSYQYDALARVTQIDLPDGSGIGYRLDATNLTDVHRLDASGAISYSHRYLKRDLSGKLIEAQLVGNGGDLHYSWDTLGRLKHLSHPCFEEQIPQGGYDAISNLLSITRRDPLDIASCQFAFDPLNQLTDETGLSNHNYSYDSLHNRLSMDSSVCVVDTLNRLLQQGDTHFSYDVQGNRIACGENRYRYDVLGRLIEVESQDGSKWEYRYDPFNRRISKKGSETTLYLYCDQVEISATHPDGTIQQLRVLGQGKGAEIGAAIAIEIDSKVYVPIHDHCGNVAVLLAADSGQVTEFYRHTAFGEETAYPDSTSINPWRFSSKRHDPETGWVLFGRRYYDPDTARWLTPDPIGFQDGPNLYAYVYNNPLSYMDPTGLRSESCPNCGRPLDENGSCSHCGYSGPDSSRRSSSREKIATPIATLVFHLVPNRTIQQTLINACSLFAGTTVLEGYFDKPYVQTKLGTGNDVMVMNNGICVSRFEAEARINEMFEDMGDVTIIGCVYPSCGAVADLFNTGLSIFGINTELSQVADEALRFGTDIAKDRDGYVVTADHSKGGWTGHRAREKLDKETKTIVHSITAASAKLEDDSDLAGISNLLYTNECVVIIGDPWGYMKARCGSSSVNFRSLTPSNRRPSSCHGYEHYKKEVVKEAKTALKELNNR